MNNNLKILRELFILKFCKKRGWNPDDLTTGQMLIIVNDPQYKKPKL
jgi:hypothetical protein